jgi:hypothetical protein
MNAPQSDSRYLKHETAVLNSLRMADAAAVSGDYHEALSWLEVVRATGDELPDQYEHKRASWLNKLRPTSSSGAAVGRRGETRCVARG